MTGRTKPINLTPGPWVAKKIDIPTDRFLPDGERIVEGAWTIIGPEDWVARDRDLAESNAIAIAALPDMVAELVDYEDICSRYAGGGCDAVELFDELMEIYNGRKALALAKIKGGK